MTSPSGEERNVDFLLWDLNEEQLTAEQFSRQTCADLGLSTEIENLMSRSIRSQLSGFPSDETEKEEKEEQSMTIKVDITIAGITLRDQFEWPVVLPGLSSLATSAPEEFAFKTVREIGLSLEFIQAISFSIREQIATVIKSPKSLQQQQKQRLREQSDVVHWGPIIIPASAAIILPGSVMVPVAGVASQSHHSPKQQSTTTSSTFTGDGPQPVSMSQYAHSIGSSDTHQ